MAVRRKNRRQFAFRDLWPVDVPAQIKSWERFQGDFFDRIIAPVHDAVNLRVQGRFRPHRPEALGDEQLLSHGGFPAFPGMAGRWRSEVGPLVVRTDRRMAGVFRRGREIGHQSCHGIRPSGFRRLGDDQIRWYGPGSARLLFLVHDFGGRNGHDIILPGFQFQRSGGSGD